MAPRLQYIHLTDIGLIKLAEFAKVSDNTHSFKAQSGLISVIPLAGDY